MDTLKTKTGLTISPVDDPDPALNPELDRLSRRKFLGRTGAKAAGVLAATALGQVLLSRRADAEPDDIETYDITYPSPNPDGSVTDIIGYLAVPLNVANPGNVIVIQQIFGLNDHIKDIVRRVARAGYVALGPDFFTRKPDDSNIPDVQVLDDLVAGVDYMRGLEISNQKVGTVGFCWGGRNSMLANAYQSGLDCCVAYYGRIVGTKTDNQPEHPLDVVDRMTGPLMGHFGELDGSIPLSTVEALRDALDARGLTEEIYIYEGAGHAFNDDTRQSYNEAAARLAWERTLRWFETYLTAE